MQLPYLVVAVPTPPHRYITLAPHLRSNKDDELFVAEPVVPKRRRKHASSVPGTRDELDGAVSSLPRTFSFPSPFLSPHTPVGSPLIVARVGLQIHSPRAGLLLANPISPTSFYALVTRLPDSTNSSPLSTPPSTPPPPAYKLLPPAVIHTSLETPKPKVVSLPILDDDMPDLNDPRYDGSGTSDDAMDFLKSLNLLHRKSKPALSDDEKLADVGDRFRTNSPPDRWFRGQNFSSSWSKFVTEFTARFASLLITVKPLGQRRAELHGIRVGDSDLVGAGTPVYGGTVMPFDGFQSRVREAVLEAEAGLSNEGLWGFHDALPVAFRTAIPAEPKDWNAMMAALQALLKHTIEAAALERRQTSAVVALEKGKAALDVKLAAVDRMMAGLSVMAGQRQQQQQQQQQQRVPGAQQAAAGAGAERAPPRAQNAGAGAGGRIPPATAESRTQLERVLRESSARQHPDTAAGRAAHAADVRSWNDRNPNLAPNTAPPRSGECWTCGMRTDPVHIRGCTGAAVPDLERRFRAVCTMWLGIDAAARAAAQTAPPVAVNVVEVEMEEEGTPWYDAGDAETAGEDRVFG
ncbi:hypothetical protein FB45DRAFT_1087872 [Roridomyces roridus]|uniref:Uncharacterized protein n=1 Tax=Roridomyces roridus TaxID=1738132 RepID=A0AAD7BJD5_9AGAR|nr:hypothetical protein FB45DRAFT_1087872 [Roridomyces roridus]